MQIDLPAELIQRAKQRAATTGGLTEADVFRRALDALDWQDNERRAIQQGIDDMNAGRVQDFEEFAREFRDKNGISPDA